MMKFQDGEQFAQLLDNQDELRVFRQEFLLSDPEEIYLDGNSLGPLPTRTQKKLQDTIKIQWGMDKIRGWNRYWLELPQKVGGKIAQLIGAEEEEVLVSDSTSINLFKLAAAAIRFQHPRFQVVTDEFNFSTDLYILQGLKSYFAPEMELRVVPSRDGIHIDFAEVAAAIGEETALVYLSHVAFKSGFVHDLAKIMRTAHSKGALVLADLSHSVGILPIQLNRWQVDLAVGCTYKYLNGGPGSPAFLFVRKKIQSQLENPIAGWFGHQCPFAFAPEYQPAKGLRRFLVGTPPILSLAPIETGVDLLLEAGIPALRKKSVAMTEYFRFLFGIHLEKHGFEWASPIDPELRGGHVALRHKEGYRIARALIDKKKVVPDFREPDILRFAFSPLYTRFVDVFQAVVRIKGVMEDRIFAQFSEQRLPVT